MKKLKQGFLQVYTGNGKGKTTAALGLAFRALGHEYKIKIIQFQKGGIGYGEIIQSKQHPNLEIIQTGTPDFVDTKNPNQIDIDEAKRGLELAKGEIEKNEVDILILDEILIAIDLNLISEEEFIKYIINQKPKDLELVLTGRNASNKIKNLADLVTEMKEVKHYYSKSIDAREGIEY